MTNTIICYIIYLTTSISLTIWVARTLYTNGKVFLVEAFRGDQEKASAVNHLLVVGFYLINIGFIAFALKYGAKPDSLQAAFEFVSTKLGIVSLVLGGMHFFNMRNFSRLRRKGQEPPVTVATQN